MMPKALLVLVFSVFSGAALAQTPDFGGDVKTLRERISAASSCEELVAIAADLEAVNKVAYEYEFTLNQAVANFESAKTYNEAWTGLWLGTLGGSIVLRAANAVFKGNHRAGEFLRRKLISGKAIEAIDWTKSVLFWGSSVPMIGAFFSSPSVGEARKEVANLTDKLRLIQDRTGLLHELLILKSRQIQGCVILSAQ
jgi:hypothetical protein